MNLTSGDLELIHDGTDPSGYYNVEIFCPRVAMPRRRPRCCFLNFTFFGINIGFVLR